MPRVVRKHGVQPTIYIAAYIIFNRCCCLLSILLKWKFRLRTIVNGWVIKNTSNFFSNSLLSVKMRYANINTYLCGAILGLNASPLTPDAATCLSNLHCGMPDFDCEGTDIKEYLQKKKQPLTILIDVNQAECVPRFRPKHGEGGTWLVAIGCKCCK